MSKDNFVFIYFCLLLQQYAESEKAIIKKGLQQCLEDSPIGEFPARLSILRTFLQEFNLGTSTKQSRKFLIYIFKCIKSNLNGVYSLLKISLIFYKV